MSEDIEQQAETTKEPDIEKEIIKVSDKLSIVTFSIEHNLEEWQKHQEQLKNNIKQTDGVIFEYFPLEINQVAQNKLFSEFYDMSKILPFFNNVAQAAHAEGKKAYVLDPAHDANFAFIKGTQVISIIGGPMASLLSSVELAHAHLSSRYKLTRRGFLARLGVLASSVGLSALGIKEGLERKNEIQSKTPSTAFTEMAIRRAIVSRGINNLGENIDKDPNKGATSLLLVYPPVHIEGIKMMLEDEKLREGMFSIAERLKNVSPDIQNSFFSIREYSPNGKGWQLVRRAEIK